MLGSFFGYDRARKYIRLLPPDAGLFEHPRSSLNGDDVTVYFSHKRERRLHAQVTHVWIRCLHVSDGSYCLRHEGTTLDYLNVWTLSKLLIQLHRGDNLQVLPLKVRHHMVEDGSAFPLEPGGEALPLVRTVRARAHRAAPSQLDALKETKAKQQKQRGPVRKFIAPVPSIAHSLPDEHLCELSSEDVSGDASDAPPPPDRFPSAPRTDVGPRPEAGAGHADYEDVDDAPPSVLAALFGKKEHGRGTAGTAGF